MQAACITLRETELENDEAEGGHRHHADADQKSRRRSEADREVGHDREGIADCTGCPCTRRAGSPRLT